MTILWFILVLILIIGSTIIYWQVVNAQTVAPPPASDTETGPTPPANKPTPTPPANTPTPPAIVQPSPTVATPTAPNPNFQYLPQKSYVQTFAPEVGIPSSTSLTPIQPVQTVPTTGGGGGIDGLNIMSVLGIVAAGGAYLKGHLANQKANNNQEVIKENSTAIVDSKVVQQEIARYMFNLDKAKADALNDAPAIKLEKLEEDKKVATDTAAKA